MVSENNYEWSDFQILQKSYLTKRKIEMALLQISLEEENFSAVESKLSNYCENARMFGFPEIENISKEVLNKIVLKRYSEAKEYLLRLQVIVDDYFCSL